MAWLGMSARGLTGLHWFSSSVNGEVYQKEILKKVVVNDVMKRKGTKRSGVPVHKRKLFKSNKKFVFQQDFATPHSTNKNQIFMEENFPNHTPTLHRYRESGHEWFFPPKLDDFWPIERVWANLAKEVYRDPRPKHIQGVMRRVRDAVANFDDKTLVKMVHGLPAKMQKITK